MPQRTKHYDLTAFTFGDSYSASADKRRFSIIDNQLSFLSEQIGDGVIDGWGIEQVDSETVRIMPGMGIIDNFLTVTHGHFDYVTPLNSRRYLFLRRKPEIMSDTSAFSEIETITYNDNDPPEKPEQPNIVDTAFNYIHINWNESTDHDFDRYRLYRNENGGSFELISELHNNEYIDNNVDQNTEYRYRISAIDINDNESLPSDELLTSTDLDTRIPNDAVDLEAFSGNSTIQVYWGASDFLADGYKLIIQPITLDGIPDGVREEYTVSSTTFYYIFEGLENNQTYEITLKTISPTGFESEGISTRGTPAFTNEASEITNIQWSDYSLDSTFTRIAIDISWDLQDSEYALDPDYYLITVYRDGEDGVASSYTSNSITIHRYTVNIGNRQFVRNIQENTRYTIRIQTAYDDAISNGFVVKIRTNKFSPPAAITDLTVESSYSVNQRSVEATWTNSISDYAYNELTVVKISLDSDDEYLSDSPLTIIDRENIGKLSRYSLDVDDIENHYRYEFYITVFDSFGNSSIETAGSTVISVNVDTVINNGVTQTNTGERPPVPNEQFGISGNDQATIYWNEPNSDIIDGYKIYRAVYSDQLSPSSFQSVTDDYIIPKDTRKFSDYTVDNGNKYVYFVTSIDRFGNESLNPSDNYSYYALIFIEPRAHLNINLNKAPAISVAASGRDVVINWQNAEDDFDGYQIWRSRNNLHSWEPVGSADVLQNSYVDTDALTLSGQYYYMIRKFKNEAELYVSRNKIAPVNSVILGSVARSSNGIAIDTEDSYDLELLADPIRDEVDSQMDGPTHLFWSRDDDRRVRLQKNLTIDRWETLDFQKYTTDTSIVSTDRYIAYIDGLQSPYNTVVNTEDRSITFERPIFDLSVNDGVPEEYQIEPPEVSVIFLDVLETEGVLSSELIEDQSASKITKGKIPLDRIPDLDHFGRYRERLEAVKRELRRDTSFTFTGSTPNGITFYDIHKLKDGIVAATSAGVMMTSDLGGNQWDNKLQANYGFSRLIYSEYLDMYFASSGGIVYTSTDTNSWSRPVGLDGVSIVRDICDSGKGEVYVSTDAGVFIIEPLKFTKQFFRQLDILDSRDINSYGISWDHYEDKLIASGSQGIYELNENETWYKLSDENIFVPCHSIVVTNDYYFAIGNNKVFRNLKGSNDFPVIGDFAFSCRRAVIFEDDLYITTNDGLYRSTSDSDIYNDLDVKWQIAFQSNTINGILPVTHALRVQDGRLWMGQDERIYSATKQRRLFTHAEFSQVCPTIYVDDSKVEIGVYWGHANRIIFDTQIANESKVLMTNQYAEFAAPNGGWADLKFDAEVLLTLNGIDQIGPPQLVLIDGRWWRFPPAPWKPSSSPTFIAPILRQVQAPTSFNGRTSNFDKALESLQRLTLLSDRVTELELIQQEFVPAEMVSEFFKELENFRTLVHPEIRDAIRVPRLTGSMSIDGFNATYDVVHGIINVSGGITKYDRLELSVKGTAITDNGFLSHDDIEESFEKWNSGLTMPLANVQHSNLIKSGIYKKLFLDDQLKIKDYSYQSTFNAAKDVDWYDKIFSTIDYRLKHEQSPTTQLVGGFDSSGFSIEYPSDIIYITTKDEVWICGSGGIISINATSLVVTKVISSPFYFYNLSLADDKVWTISEDGLYSVDINTRQVVKDTSVDLPENYSSVYVSGDTTYIATYEGLYYKRSFENRWTESFELIDARIRSANDLTFTLGRSVDNELDAVAYYSYGGVIWNRSNVFPNMTINSVAKRYNNIYYASNKGLISEDISGLFSDNNFQAPVLARVNLEDTGNDEIIINDVDATNDRAVAVSAEGQWYALNGIELSDSGISRLETIHRVKIVNGKYWLFSDNLVEIEDNNRLIQLSTGKALV